MKTLWAASLLLAGCGDETVTGFADATRFALSTLDGRAFDATATLDIGTTGRISGAGPCNTYNATQSAPYPWFEIGPIAATRRACPDLNAEQLYFESLSQMTNVEVLGDVLILRNEGGGEMVFNAL
jgi:heat shock protein HslJ